ncbi:MAG: hypothetical protein FWG17_01505 [Desulfovibrionaceae bacterium]|nr:hypothetical protein [Desulfovibrionaceae bacterium]
MTKYIIFSISWCVLIAFSFGLSRGEFVENAYQAALDRQTDFQAPVLLNNNETLHTQHPVYVAFAEVAGHTFPAYFFRALLALGMDYYITLAVSMIFFRALALLAVFLWLRWVGAQYWCAFLITPLLLGISWGTIYSYLPWAANNGQIAISLFLIACAVLLFRWHKISLMILLLLAWSHPSSFLAWSPLYGALWLYATGLLDNEAMLKRISSRLTPVKARNLIYGALVAIPLIVGTGVAFLEFAGAIDLNADDYYWDFVVSRFVHSLWGGVRDAAHIPMRYLLLVAGLFILSEAAAPVPQRLHFINRCASSIGFSLFCIYILYVETRFSIAVNMIIPLRFETILLPLLLFNIFSIIFAKKEECDYEASYATEPWIFCLVCGFMINLLLFNEHFGLYFLPFYIYTGVLFTKLINKDKTNFFKKQTIVFSTAFLIIFLTSFYFLAPNLPRLSEGIRLLAIPSDWSLSIFIFAALLWMITRICIKTNTYTIVQTSMPKIYMVVILVFIVDIYIKRLPQIYDLQKARTEVALLAQGARAGTLDSPWNHFLEWQRKTIAPSDKILVHPYLYLNFLAIPWISIQYESVVYTFYAPKEAALSAEHLLHIYNIDIAAYAKKNTRISSTMGGEGWNYAKNTYLGAGNGSKACQAKNPGKPCFQWVAEPIFDTGATVQVSYPESVVFANSVIRVYAVPR